MHPLSYREELAFLQGNEEPRCERDLRHRQRQERIRIFGPAGEQMTYP